MSENFGNTSWVMTRGLEYISSANISYSFYVGNLILMFKTNGNGN